MEYDARIDQFRRISVLRETGSLGAEVTGIDLSQNIDDDTKTFLRSALAEHLVIYFRGSRISPDLHISLSRIFGPDEPIPHLNSREGYPQIQFIQTDADDQAGYVVGENWHADSTYLARPPGGVVMRAATLPTVGGDTLFANMYQVFETLSPPLKDFLRGVRAVHAAKKVFGSQAKSYRESAIKKMSVDAGDAEITHPAVCRHHVTGREFLYVNQVYTQRFEGMTSDESAGLLAYLYTHIARPQFQCRVRWQPEQVLVWDNRAAQHRAVPDYIGEARCMERTTFGAPEPSNLPPACD